MQICNIVEDIIMSVKKIDNIKFIYCRRYVIEMTDKIVKRILMYCKQKVVSNENFPCFFFLKK